MRDVVSVAISGAVSKWDVVTCDAILYNVMYFLYSCGNVASTS